MNYKQFLAMLAINTVGTCLGIALYWAFQPSAKQSIIDAEVELARIRVTGALDKAFSFDAPSQEKLKYLKLSTADSMFLERYNFERDNSGTTKLRPRQEKPPTAPVP